MILPFLVRCGIHSKSIRGFTGVLQWFSQGEPARPTRGRFGHDSPPCFNKWCHYYLFFCRKLLHVALWGSMWDPFKIHKGIHWRFTMVFPRARPLARLGTIRARFAPLFQKIMSLLFDFGRKTASCWPLGFDVGSSQNP